MMAYMLIGPSSKFKAEVAQSKITTPHQLNNVVTSSLRMQNKPGNYNMPSGVKQSQTSSTSFKMILLKTILLPLKM
jgi:hypothetical protein